MKAEAIGVIARPGSDISKRIAVRTIEILKNLGAEPLVERETKHAYPDLEAPGVFDVERDPPAKIVVIGGDGTLLRAALRLGDKDALIMAVRAGKRGFLLDIDESTLEERLRDFVEGRLTVVEHQRVRPLLNETPLPCVLNDVVIFTAEGSMVRADVYSIDGERIMGVDGDGIVISTTTGSTAYSLNAGGPIIDPLLDVVVVTPLNPVQLFLRPVVIGRSRGVRVRVRADSGSSLLILDGQVKYPLRPNDEVKVVPCPKPLRVARYQWWSGYYDRLFARLLSYW